MVLINRVDELAALEKWWERRNGGLALLWGRRRVGKTAILRQFASSRRSIFHVGSQRPVLAELEQFARHVAVAGIVPGRRDFASRPLTTWTDAIETLASASVDEPTLLVLDEFPELLDASPDLPSTLRALWEEVGTHTKLRIVLCGSAVRTMEALQEERAPLYGRFDLALPIHPFKPHEAALMLPDLSPSDRALVWGIVGGIPLYLSWWDQTADIATNIEELVGTPGGRLLTEGQLLLDTEADSGDLGRRVMYAISVGKTRNNEIADAISADPTRTLDRLVALRLIERLVPVTDDPRRTRRRTYRIADNFLAFWLGIVERHRTEIEMGLGPTITATLIAGLDGHLGARWEEAFRLHLRRLARAGELGSDVVAIGQIWQDNVAEVDAAVLSGRSRSITMAGEAKWARVADGRRLEAGLGRKLAALGLPTEDVRFALCARERIDGADSQSLIVTAHDIFG